MKRIFLIAVIGVCSVAVNAQRLGTTKFSIGPEVGFATGTSATSNGLGGGATIQAEHFYQENISATLLFGFVGYTGRSLNSTSNYKAFNVFPLRIGGRYYIGEGFHLGAQLGVGFATGGTAFAYSPQVGYNFKTNKGKKIDATFKYDGYVNNGTFSALGIRLAYIF